MRVLWNLWMCIGCNVLSRAQKMVVLPRRWVAANFRPHCPLRLRMLLGEQCLPAEGCRLRPKSPPAAAGCKQNPCRRLASTLGKEIHFRIASSQTEQCSPLADHQWPIASRSSENTPALVVWHVHTPCGKAPTEQMRARRVNKEEDGHMDHSLSGLGCTACGCTVRARHACSQAQT